MIVVVVETQEVNNLPAVASIIDTDKPLVGITFEDYLKQYAKAYTADCYTVEMNFSLPNNVYRLSDCFEEIKIPTGPISIESYISLDYY